MGCALLTEASTGAPQGCTLAFTGTTTTGKSVVETCAYEGTVAKAAMVECGFPLLEGLVKVEITVARTASTADTTVFFLDDAVLTDHY